VSVLSVWAQAVVSILLVRRELKRKFGSLSHKAESQLS
jgi:hypothetical protein